MIIIKAVKQENWKRIGADYLTSLKIHPQSGIFRNEPVISGGYASSLHINNKLFILFTCFLIWRLEW